MPLTGGHRLWCGVQKGEERESRLFAGGQGRLAETAGSESKVMASPELIPAWNTQCSDLASTFTVLICTTLDFELA